MSVFLLKSFIISRSDQANRNRRKIAGTKIISECSFIWPEILKGDKNYVCAVPVEWEITLYAQLNSGWERAKGKVGYEGKEHILHN